MSARRLLVIDDSPTIRKLVELSFNGTPWTVEFAPTGHDGVTKARAWSPDVILLDYVLPDMRGTDVCERLKNDAAANIPIILMSAKDENVRELFREYPAVSEFMGKPFQAQDVVSRADRLLRKRVDDGSAAEARPTSRFTFAQREALAHVLYQKLRPQLALIPEHAARLGSEAPAPYFARKLLTPGLMDELCEALLPTMREVLGVSNRDLGTCFEGQLGTMCVRDLLSLFTTGEHSGCLTLRHADQQIEIYVRAAQVVMVVNHDPPTYLRDAPPLESIRPEWMARADAEQRASGKPVYVSLAEAGALSAEDLPQLLRRQGTRLLGAVARSNQWSFEWQEGAAEPLYVEAFGVPVPIEQVDLEWLRSHPRQGELDERQRFARAPGFSRKIGQFELDDLERQVAVLSDGRSSLSEVAARAGTSTAEVLALSRRLEAVGLLAEAPRAPRPRANGPVLIVDSDIDSLCDALSRMLVRAGRPVAVVGSSGDEDALVLIGRERPRMAIINASEHGKAAVHTARAVRAAPDLSQLSLVALLDAPSPDLTQQLTTAGFDAVLMKPVLFADLEALLPT